MTPEQTSKLSDIQNMALDFNKRLQRHAPDGGCLFLGRFYAESRRIFLGLNPGGLARTFNVNLTDHHGYNPPFHNPDRQRKDNAFWRNCEDFLALHPDLRAWFLDGVTSTNLVPWRTEKAGNELRHLNDRTGKKLFRYSGQLLNFSRAKHRGLDEKGFADWLRVQLRPFGLAQAAGASA